jgi:hypothetical protein
VHERAGVDDHDIARPAEFLIDRQLTVRWRNITPDYRVRLRPEVVIEEASTLR